MVKIILLALLSLSTWYQSVLTEGATNPGLQLAVTSKGLDYGELLQFESESVPHSTCVCFLINSIINFVN